MSRIRIQRLETSSSGPVSNKDIEPVKRLKPKEDRVRVTPDDIDLIWNQIDEIIETLDEITQDELANWMTKFLEYDVLYEKIWDRQGYFFSLDGEYIDRHYPVFLCGLV